MSLTNFLAVKRRTIYSRLIRNRSTQLKRLNPSIKYLNAGCGEKQRPAFINLEYWWHPGIDLCWDVTNRLPFEDDSLEGVFTEHCLEHLSLNGAKAALREFRRIIRPGGVCRIVLPNAGLYLDTYAKWKQGERAAFPFDRTSEPNWTPMAEVNLVMRRDGYLYGYDPETVKILLLDAGFGEAEETSYLKGRDSHLLIDSEDRACESLYVEGIK